MPISIIVAIGNIISDVTSTLGISTNPSKSNGLQGLQDFYRVASERGFARDFHFRVTQIGDTKLGDNDLVYVRSASIPNRTINSENVYYRGFKFNVPMAVEYDSESWSIEILMDRDYQIYNVLETWHKNYYNENTFAGTEMPASDKLIELIAVNDNFDVLKKFRLYGCFPKELGELQFNLAGQGAPISLKLSLAYQYWNSETLKLPQGQSQGLIGNLLNGLRTVTGLIQTGNVIKQTARSVSNLI